MLCWKLLAIVLVHLGSSSFVYPVCLVCADAEEGTRCHSFDASPIGGTNITVKCESPNVANDTSINFSEDYELFENSTAGQFNGTTTDDSIVSPVEHLFHNRTAAFENVRYLTFSYNSIDRFSGQFDNLIYLDLSHNLISNISQSQFHSPQLAHLVISNNYLKSLCNFSHNNLQYLDAKYNNLNKLCLGSLPKLKSLNLGGNTITEIDKLLATQTPKLEILNLSTNSIAQLNDYNFNLSSLLRLYLGNNHISYLSEKCFYGLNKLQFLDISGNQITTVFPSMFQYIPLVQLIVSNNPKLMTQDFGILLASERLKCVNASRTNQFKIPACLTRSVRFLSLSHNMISQIQCGDLDSYPLLNSLDLSYNNISFIEDDALGRLELLETILLSHNHLTFIPYTLPNNLKALYLDHNSLSKIMPSDFTGLVKLNILDLSQSNVVSIADGSFSQMYGLVSLNLSMNPIEVVSIETFAGPHKLKILDLSGLSNMTKCKQDLCFPVPEPNELSELYIKESPELGHRLMNDAAALKTFKQLALLNMENCNISDVPTDVPNYFPRLRYLNLARNELNCSKIQSLYVWSDINEIAECIFVINEKVTTTTTRAPNMQTLPPSGVSQQNFVRQDARYPAEMSRVTSEDLVSLEMFMKNNSLRYTEETEVISNEIWLSDDNLGVVDAYSAQAPSSHPGLLILLLLPVALAGVALFLNYSRLRRKIRTERRCEMDIEISNISSELW